MGQQRERRTVVPLAKKGATMDKRKAAGIGKVRASHKEQSNIIAKEGGYEMETKTGFTAFDINYLGENFAKFFRYSLATTFENVAKLQEFNEKMVRDAIEASKKVQAEAERIVNESIETGKKGWSEYRKAVENGLHKVEEMIQPVK